MSEPPLAYLLLRASRWFDRQLLDRLQERGWPRLSSAQSLVFPHLVPEGISPAALSRALGVTRQSGHELVAGLVRLGFVESREDPAAPRLRRLVLSPRGHDLARDARQILAELEEDLHAGAGVGPGVDTAALRRLLEPWPPMREAESAIDAGASGSGPRGRRVLRVEPHRQPVESS